jgi:hypothetical protein
LPASGAARDLATCLRHELGSTNRTGPRKRSDSAPPIGIAVPSLVLGTEPLSGCSTAPNAAAMWRAIFAVRRAFHLTGVAVKARAADLTHQVHHSRPARSRRGCVEFRHPPIVSGMG